MGRWIADHMPELDAELSALTRDEVRTRLNEITGLQVLGSDEVQESTDRILAALKAMKEPPCNESTYQS